MQYIYTMIGVSKIVPPKRSIIKDISLSFYPGAKIGLLGVNVGPLPDSITGIAPLLPRSFGRDPPHSAAAPAPPA